MTRKPVAESSWSGSPRKRGVKFGRPTSSSTIAGRGKSSGRVRGAPKHDVVILMPSLVLILPPVRCGVAGDRCARRRGPARPVGGPRAAGDRRDDRDQAGKCDEPVHLNAASTQSAGATIAPLAK